MGIFAALFEYRNRSKVTVGGDCGGLAPRKQPFLAGESIFRFRPLLNGFKKTCKKAKRRLEGEINEMKEIAASSGILLAIFARTMIPYWRKKLRAVERGEKIEWNKRYTVTSLLALLTSLIIATQTIPALTLPNDPISLLYVFTMAFGYGWGLNDVYNKIFIDWL